MGRRSRSRARPPSRRGAARASVASPGSSAPRRAGPPSRVLAGYLAGALATGVAVLLGIVLLGGTAGPLVVLGYALAAAVAARRWAGARLAGAELTAEDRILRTTATGVLVLAVLLAAASALVAALA